MKEKGKTQLEKSSLQCCREQSGKSGKEIWYALYLPYQPDTSRELSLMENSVYTNRQAFGHTFVNPHCSFKAKF